MTVYRHGNLDGTNAAMVAAKNKREAASLMGTSLYAFGQYGCSVVDPDSDDAAICLESPGVVMYKPLAFAGHWRNVRWRDWEHPSRMTNLMERRK